MMRILLIASTALATAAAYWCSKSYDNTIDLVRKEWRACQTDLDRSSARYIDLCGDLGTMDGNPFTDTDPIARQVLVESIAAEKARLSTLQERFNALSTLMVDIADRGIFKNSFF